MISCTFVPGGHSFPDFPHEKEVRAELLATRLRATVGLHNYETMSKMTIFLWMEGLDAPTVGASTGTSS